MTSGDAETPPRAAPALPEAARISACLHLNAKQGPRTAIADLKNVAASLEEALTLTASYVCTGFGPNARRIPIS